MFFVELNEAIDIQRAADLITNKLAKQFNRRDYDWQILVLDGEEIVPLVISAEDQVLIMDAIMEITQELIDGSFQPEMSFGISGAIMYSIVPHHSFMRRHIPIIDEPIDNSI